jgi:hypothetical protein
MHLLGMSSSSCRVSQLVLVLPWSPVHGAAVKNQYINEMFDEWWQIDARKELGTAAGVLCDEDEQTFCVTPHTAPIALYTHAVWQVRALS